MQTVTLAQWKKRYAIWRGMQMWKLSSKWGKFSIESYLKMKLRFFTHLAKPNSCCKLCRPFRIIFWATSTESKQKPFIKLLFFLRWSIRQPLTKRRFDFVIFNSHLHVEKSELFFHWVNFNVCLCTVPYTYTQTSTYEYLPWWICEITQTYARTHMHAYALNTCCDGM